jgi:hypothetical protein
MTETTDKKQWGSKRPGAGRPTKHRRLVGFKLRPETDEALEQAARTHQVSKSELVEQAIKRHLPKEFRRQRGIKREPSIREKLRGYWPEVSMRLSPEQWVELRAEYAKHERPVVKLILPYIDRWLEEQRQKPAS